DNGDAGASPSHNLYRTVVPYDAASKPAANASAILLGNVYPNPADSSGVARPCFKYQWVKINGLQYVLDVAITLTVQTQQIDPAQYAKPGTVATDVLASYDFSGSPVKYNGQPVVLSSDSSVPSNYPVAAVVTAFNTAARGSVTAGGRTITYRAYAKLLSMQTF